MISKRMISKRMISKRMISKRISKRMMAKPMVPSRRISRRVTRTLRVLAAMAAMIVGAAPAAAQPKPPAEFVTEFQAGIDAYRLGAHAEARAHLDRAKAIDPSLPGPHRFLAAVDAAEGKWQECVDDARRAIIANPASNEIAATRKLHDDCRTSLGLAPFTGNYGDGGAVSVTANVAGAAVSVAGLRSGSTPLAPRPIGLGPVEISATKSGWRTATTTVTVIPGVVTDVALVLIEEPATLVIDGGEAIPDRGWLIVTAPAGAEVKIDGAIGVADGRGRYELSAGDHEVEVSQAAALTTTRTVRVSRGQERRVSIELVSVAGAARQRTLGRAALGAAVGFGGLGVVVAILSIHASDEARGWATIEATRPSSAPLDETIPYAPLHTRAEIEARGDRANTLAIASGVSYLLSAVALGTGVYLLSRAPADTRVEIAPMLGDGWGVSVGGVLP